ncbi:hypothetical protein [Sphingomonas psychrotolerans]|uniref:hypothetical protein n=1 Tax=Sphingomonas psychrotolerans TaxID=1327635 RepID=UPI0018F44F1B|nr:hypothetical protein [Sphingomonas psychrotolerans]
MNTLETGNVASLLDKLHQDAHVADHAHVEKVMAEIEASGEGAGQWATKLLEPHLRTGAMALGGNAFDPQYQAYVRDPANGYLSQALAIDEGRGNEFTVRTR